jgi:hypothetical protein
MQITAKSEECIEPEDDYAEDLDRFISNCFDSNWKALDRKDKGFLRREKALYFVQDAMLEIAGPISISFEFKDLWEKHQFKGVIGKNEMVSLLKEAMGLDTNLI